MTSEKLTPEQIDKEKAEKVEKAPVIQPNKADIEEPEINTTELGKANKDKLKLITPPKESARQYAKKVGDYNRVVEIAKEKGVDLDNIGAMPLIDSDKGKITDAVKRSYGRELATGIQGISDAITAPQNEERNKLDVKKLMNEQKRIRRAKFSDSLYAFGEGLQGKGVDPEKFTTTRLVRQRDEQFQKFKDVTERNKKTKYIWENQTKKELVDWAEKESRNMEQNQEYRDKMKMIAEQNVQDQAKYAQDQKNKDRGYRIQEDRNNIARNKKSGTAVKAEKTVNVQTAKNTYELMPEEADRYREEVISNPEKYPKLFHKVQKFEKVSGFDIPIDGEFTYKMKDRYEDVDLIRAYLEVNKDGFPQFDESKARLLKIYKDRGDLNEQPQTTTKPQSQPKQTAKSDPLGLFSTEAAPRTQSQPKQSAPKQSTQKSQYSTGGLY